jgi:hypothetical protein
MNPSAEYEFSFVRHTATFTSAYVRPFVCYVRQPRCKTKITKNSYKNHENKTYKNHKQTRSKIGDYGITAQSVISDFRLVARQPIARLLDDRPKTCGPIFRTIFSLTASTKGRYTRFHAQTAARRDNACTKFQYPSEKFPVRGSVIHFPNFSVQPEVIN